MKKRHFVLILLIIAAISFTLPLWFSSDWDKYFDYSTTILGALCTVYALVIAILLYDRFSVERDVLSKQLEAVSTLVQNLYLEEMYMEVVENTNSTFVYYKLKGDAPETEWNEYPEEIEDSEIWLSESAYERLLAISSGVQLLYLPSSIYSALERLLGYKSGGQTQEFSKVKIILFNPLTDYRPSPSELNPEKFLLFAHTFGAFINDYRELYESISKWFQEHGYDKARMSLSFPKHSVNYYESYESYIEKWPEPNPDIKFHFHCGWNKS